eukprot:12628444-Heterocapsa_arctica.AAC.1
MGKRPAELTSAGAYLELCGSSLPYLSEGDGPVPYDRDLVSLPDVGVSAVPCEPLLTSAHRDLVEGGHASMLRTAEGAAQALELEG